MSEQSPPQPSSALPSPLGLAHQVEQLMKLPQHLCKQRGQCCRVATFKGSLSYEEILALAANPEAEGHESARDFASVFLPYESQTQVREIASEFVDKVRTAARSKGQDPDQVSFFKCKYVLADGRCGVHEDRPVGCRMYPFPHKNTIYHPGCGFEQQGQENWAKIDAILKQLGLSL
ncbi:YkgJ family cysteine cluster protein [Vampirovibrio chlorellavorus]|uniref:YkgJ family cysteine cluster protein n=1 Tax=Vampirovibrio chlorellavorus TaxID=758823 RepID=UPI0026F35AC2|nr:YkgJ family cysteine cluster protein [Vampirovibrio chlorellavorus]